MNLRVIDQAFLVIVLLLCLIGLGVLNQHDELQPINLTADDVRAAK